MHFQVVLFIVMYRTILWDFPYCLILCIALSLWHSKPLNFWLQFKQRQRLLLLSWYWVMFKMILFWVNWNWPYKVNFLSLVFQDARHLSQGKKSISFQWLCKIWSSFFDNMVVLDLWKYHLLLNHKSVIFHLLSHVSTCIEKQYLLMLILASQNWILISISTNYYIFVWKCNETVTTRNDCSSFICSCRSIKEFIILLFISYKTTIFKQKFLKRYLFCTLNY